MTYAFTFDASACSGCKACQVACKDRNNLPVGVFWRRVIEVSGGEWTKEGAAWNNTVFAYNLSMACNHCVHPKCAGVCPTNAYHVRSDGIVILDSTLCVGCGYCNWACPYAVPQYNPALGAMSKCNFCCDALDIGEPPACVAACPLRVLDFIEVSNQDAQLPGLSLWDIPCSEHPFPLPVFSRTQPHMLINPHPAMLNKLEKNISNREEFVSQETKSEFPLLVFSLLAQMAVGAYWAFQWIFAPLWYAVETNNQALRMLPLLFIGLILGLGGLVSFGHLGTKHNAWRVLNNLKKSWLSREIFFLALFSLGWLFSIMLSNVWVGIITSLLGVGLINSMANVYKIRSMAIWNTWVTTVKFFVTASLLGVFLLIPIWLYGSGITGIVLPITFLGMVNYFIALLLGIEFILLSITREQFSALQVKLQGSLIILLVAGLLGEIYIPDNLRLNWYVILFILLLLEEGLGRWMFYSALEYRRL